MLKILFHMLALLSVLLIFGCSTQKEYKKINKEDQQKLIAFAEMAIKALPEAKVTAAEKQAVLGSKPTIFVNYTGNKAGRYSISWNTNEKTITYTGNGDITSPESNFPKINIISVETTPLR